MDKFLEEKNKLLIFSIINLLIVYTETTITKLTIMDINFELKNTYLIKDFNTIFFIIFIYYIFQTFFHYLSFIRTEEYKELITAEEKENIILELYPTFIRWYLKIINFFMSFKFLNYYIPIIIINLTIFFKFYTNIDIFIINAGIQITIFIIFYFTNENIVNKFFKPIESDIKLLEIKLTEVDIAIQKIEDYSKDLEEKDKKILKLAYKTIKNRKCELIKLKQKIKQKIEKLKE